MLDLVHACIGLIRRDRLVQTGSLTILHPKKENPRKGNRATVTVHFRRWQARQDLLLSVELDGTAAAEGLLWRVDVWCACNSLKMQITFPRRTCNSATGLWLIWGEHGVSTHVPQVAPQLKQL